MANRWGNNGNSDRLFFLVSKIIADGDSRHEIKGRLFLGRNAMKNLDSTLKNQKHYFANKGPSNQRYGFSRSHVRMWELDHKENWALKNSCFWTVMSKKTLESPLYCKEIKPVNPKENQSWIFTERTEADAEAPILWPPDAKNWPTGKEPDTGKDWKQEKGTTEDEMVGWHHDSMDMSLGKLQEMVTDRETPHAAVHWVTKSWIWLSDRNN